MHPGNSGPFRVYRCGSGVILSKIYAPTEKAMIKDKDLKLSKGFGEKIERAMFAKGLNQAQLADKLGISRSAMSQFIHEKRFPSRLMILKMANVLSVSVDLVMGKSENSDVASLIENENIRDLVTKFSRLAVADQERIVDIINLLEQTAVKKIAPAKRSRIPGMKGESGKTRSGYGGK